MIRSNWGRVRANGRFHLLQYLGERGNTNFYKTACGLRLKTKGFPAVWENEGSKCLVCKATRSLVVRKVEEVYE